MDPAELVDDWPAERVAVIAADRVTSTVTEIGDTSEVFRLASITKVMTASPTKPFLDLEDAFAAIV